MQGPARPGQAAPDTGQSRFPPHLIRLLRRMRSACRSPRVLPIRCLLSSTTSSLAPGRRGSREIRRLDYDLRVGTRRSGPPHGGTGALRVTAIIAGSCNILAISLHVGWTCEAISA